MSHQCSCGRDLNNNYISYTNAYANGSSAMDRESNASMSTANAAHLGVGGDTGLHGSKSSGSISALSAAAMARSITSSGIGGKSSPAAQTQLTAKVMFGTVGAIKELREKEKSRQAVTRTSDRRN